MIEGPVGNIPKVTGIDINVWRQMLLSLFGLLILSFLEGLRFEVVLLSHLLN